MHSESVYVWFSSEYGSKERRRIAYLFSGCAAISTSCSVVNVTLCDTGAVDVIVNSLASSYVSE